MILFGTAGVPTSLKSRRAEEGVREVKRLGLSAMELEFVRGVRLSEEGREKVRAAAKETGVILTAHGPYYINLASLDANTVIASRERVLETARTAASCGAISITFHAAAYQGREAEAVFKLVAEELKTIQATLRKEKIQVAVSPELTGKPTQFGSLSELIRLSQTVPGIKPCLDFSHFAARDHGKNNNYQAFKQALSAIQRGLGAKALRNLHLHASGIAWSDKGERKHLMLKDSDFDWEAMLAALIATKASGVLICESPVMEEDAMFLQREYRKRAGRKK